MAKAKAAWGIEIGNAAVKAVCLERDGTDVRVVDFAVVPHARVLTTPDLNAEEMIRATLGALLSQKSIENVPVLVSMPGSEGLARFVQLPPLPEKAIEQTVMFEAKQQIPFELEEVEWDRHLFRSPDSPDIEVGIFAILKEKVAQRLSLYKELRLRPAGLTLGPVAVYNAMVYDRDLDRPGQSPMAFLDIGTRSTDLIVVRDGRCWIRTFPIGGHHFTEAISAAIDGMPYGKADRLKAETATHQHAKKLMHVMRPVFDDLLRELQRSMSHYDSLNPDHPVKHVLGLGNTFRIPGLRKFLSDQLGVEIRRMEEYQKIKVEGTAASDFAANSMNLATAIGLALQGVGLGVVNINLSPVGNLREQVWLKKGKWFVAAAAVVCAASAFLFVPLEGSVAGDVPSSVTRVQAAGRERKSKFEELKTAADSGAQANNVLFLLEDRDVWPWLVADANAATASAGVQEELLSVFDHANPPVPYEQWNTVELAELSGKYKLVPGTPAAKRTIEVTMRLLVPRDERGAKEFVQRSVLEWLTKNADRGDKVPYVIQIPATGLVPKFQQLNAPASESTGGAPSGAGIVNAEEPVAEEASGGSQAMSGRNRSDAPLFDGGRGGMLGGAGMEEPVAGDGGGSGAASGGKSAAERAKDRKAARASIKSSAAEPVDIDADAAVPAAPNLYGGRAATAVTITFTVQLRDPVGREIAPAGPAGEEGAAQ